MRESGLGRDRERRGERGGGGRWREGRRDRSIWRVREREGKEKAQRDRGGEREVVAREIWREERSEEREEGREKRR